MALSGGPRRLGAATRPNPPATPSRARVPGIFVNATRKIAKPQTRPNAPPYPPGGPQGAHTPPRDSSQLTSNGIDLFTPDGIYGAWGWRGLTAYTVGLAAEIPFMVLPDLGR
jgi:hypothetical protein